MKHGRNYGRNPNKEEKTDRTKGYGIKVELRYRGKDIISLKKDLIDRLIGRLESAESIQKIMHLEEGNRK